MAGVPPPPFLPSSDQAQQVLVLLLVLALGLVGVSSEIGCACSVSITGSPYDESAQREGCRVPWRLVLQLPAVDHQPPVGRQPPNRMLRGDHTLRCPVRLGSWLW